MFKLLPRCNSPARIDINKFCLLGFYVHCCKTSDYYVYSYVNLYQSPENVGYSEQDQKGIQMTWIPQPMK